MSTSTNWQEDGDGNLASPTGKVLVNQKARTETVSASRSIALDDMGKLLYVTNPGVTLTLVDVGVGEYEFRIRAFYDVVISGGTFYGDRTVYAHTTATVSKYDPGDNIWERQEPIGPQATNTVLLNSTGSDGYPIFQEPNAQIFEDGNTSARAAPLENLAALRAKLTADGGAVQGRIYHVAAHGTLGEGADLFYRGLASGSYTDDGGRTITPNGGADATAVQKIGRVNSDTYGLHSSKTGAQNLAALAALVAACVATNAPVEIVNDGGGDIELSDTYDITDSNLSFVGVGRPTLFNNATDRAAIRVDGASNLKFEGLRIKGNNTGTGGNMINNGDGGHGIGIFQGFHIDIQDCSFHDLGPLTSATSSSANPIFARDRGPRS